MDPILDEIEKALEKRGLSAAAASKLAAGHFSLIKNMKASKAGGKRYSVETIEKLAEVLDLEFYFGPRRDTGPVQQIMLDGNEFAQIPVHEAGLAAGCGIANGEAEVSGHLAFRRSWLKEIGVAASSAVLARAWGDSMVPTIKSGDMLLIDSARSEVPVRARSKHDHRPGQIYAILDDGMARVKRIERPEDGLLILTSDNPACGAEALTGQRMKSLNIIGRVMWWGHTNRE